MLGSGWQEWNPSAKHKCLLNTYCVPSFMSCVEGDLRDPRKISVVLRVKVNQNEPECGSGLVAH